MTNPTQSFIKMEKLTIVNQKQFFNVVLFKPFKNLMINVKETKHEATFVKED